MVSCVVLSPYGTEQFAKMVYQIKTKNKSLRKRLQNKWNNQDITQKKSYCEYN